MARSRQYITRDNGGIAFKVVYSPTVLSVYVVPRVVQIKNSGKDVKESVVRRQFTERVYTSPFTKVFVGRGEMSDGAVSSRKFVGCSLLFHLKGRTYLYVGASMYKFTSPSPIQKYYGRMGNSGVPYDCAVSNTTAYMLIERRHMPWQPGTGRDRGKHGTLGEGKVSRSGPAHEMYDMFYDIRRNTRYTAPVLHTTFYKTHWTDGPCPGSTAKFAGKGGNKPFPRPTPAKRITVIVNGRKVSRLAPV